jgi:hypothetical protein
MTTEQQLKQANLLLVKCLKTFEIFESLDEVISGFGIEIESEETREALQYAQACIKDHLKACGESFELDNE